MSLCKNCGIEIHDEATICPLCGFALESPNDHENMYPDVIRTPKKISLAARIYVTAAIVAMIASVVANYYYTPDVLWCLVVGGGLIVTYLILKVVVEYEFGYQVKIFTMVFASVLYLLLVDWVFGFTRWSLNYIFPAMILGVDVTALVLMIINFRNWQSYMVWQIFMVVIAITAVILGHFGIITKPLLSWIALFVSALFFLGTLIIGGGRAATELKRRFHLT